jgi:hypothetical protein
MQSDPPQGDPRLQRIYPGPQVTTGYVDPCIVYLETTLPGEIPLLVACWASSSHEIKNVGSKTYWALKNVVVLECRFDRPSYKLAPGWTFSIHREESLVLRHGIPDRKFVRSSSYFSGWFEFAPVPVFQWAIRFLDRETDSALRNNAGIREILGTNNPYKNVPRSGLRQAFRENQAYKKLITFKLLQQSKLDWPSIAEVLAFLEPVPLPLRERHPSLIHRLISSVFKKKPQPLPA